MRTAESELVSRDCEYIVLYGVPWKTYEGILDAIGGYHLRHTYDRGTFELRRVLYGVAWEDYLKLLDATPDLYLRHTYDRGTLEMMSPRKNHDRVANLIARMIEAFAFAADVPIQSVASMTIRAKGWSRPPARQVVLPGQRAIGALQGYLRSSSRSAPDLVWEVDVTHTSVPRMPVFAKIGVPEVWRLDKRGRLRFYQLTGAKYTEIQNSVSFSFATPADFMRFVDRRNEIGENAVVREFIKWAKKARGKERK